MLVVAYSFSFRETSQERSKNVLGTSSGRQFNHNPWNIFIEIFLYSLIPSVYQILQSYNGTSSGRCVPAGLMQGIKWSSKQVFISGDKFMPEMH